MASAELGRRVEKVVGYPRLSEMGASEPARNSPGLDLSTSVSLPLTAR
jgi:hypothetical protein